VTFSAFLSKDIILVILGLSLSLAFTKSLFEKIVYFVIEFSYGVFAFGFSFVPLGSGKISKEQIGTINQVIAERSAALLRINKSIVCNSAISMSLLLFLICCLSFKSIGYAISAFDIFWVMMLECAFVYISYFVWQYFKDNSHWENRHMMSVSKYNILISISTIIFLNYQLCFGYAEGYNKTFVITSVALIFFLTRVYRIPHLHASDGRDEGVGRNEDFYLADIGKEIFIFSGVFLSLYFIHHFGKEHVQSSAFGLYVSSHPIRSSISVFAIPLVAFGITFLKHVPVGSIFGYLLYIKKPIVTQ
jgi:hypothetical protein